MILSVVNGSTITFVNNTTTSKTILSTDSTIIPVTVVPAGGSYLFKKDTTASFQYYQKGKTCYHRCDQPHTIIACRI